ncbi:MAG: hypothetical protein CMJ72_09275, partial [Planctomycetaceae bacterium]|nr:hypothetical protein [Planctomycetaceae bacterium]
ISTKAPGHLGPAAGGFRQTSDASFAIRDITIRDITIRDITIRDIAIGDKPHGKSDFAQVIRRSLFSFLFKSNYTNRFSTI